MNGYKFVVDKGLLIVSWDAEGKSSHGCDVAKFLGVPYYQVIPRILLDGADALELVLRDGSPRLIKGYKAMCIFGSASGDIAVRPLFDDNREAVGVEVRIEGFTRCSAVDCRRTEPENMEIANKSITLAHGVRSPLNAIKGAAVYLKGKYRTEAGLVEFMDIIENEISKLDSFVTKFLSTSLVESEFTRVDIVAMLEKIIALVSLQAKMHNIVINSELKELPLIKADEYLLEHAVLNVINNSIEALDDGGTIKVSTEKVRQNEREFIAIEIADDGYGINRSRVRDISNESNEKRNTAGRGFGLFITREVAQYHGGQLEIDSRRNSGTRVSILLPVSAP